MERQQLKTTGNRALTQGQKQRMMRKATDSEVIKGKGMQQLRQNDTWKDNGHSEEHHHMAARVRQLV